MFRFPYRLLLLLLCVGLSPMLWAAYLIPYELRLYQPGFPKPRLERYSVLVILANHFGNHFGPPDGLQELLAANYYSDEEPFISDYRRFLKEEWYLQQVTDPKRARRYQLDPEVLRAQFRQLGAADDALSSDVIITEYRNFRKPLALVRTTVEDALGRVPAETLFLGKGLSGPFERDEKIEPGVIRLPRFNPISTFPTALALGYPLSTQLVEGEIGGNLEAKNFALDPETALKFLPHQFEIAWRHRIFFLTGRKTAAGKGVYASRVWVGCTGDKMRHLHEAWSFNLRETVNNEHTLFRDAHFMHTAPEQMQGSVQNYLSLMDSTLTDPKDQWLVYDKEMVAEFNKLQCRKRLLRESGRRSRARR